MEAHENMISHRGRTRRITNEHTRAEAAVNYSLENFGCCVKEAAAATHSLTCGISDRKSNEIKYLRVAIDEWHRRRQGVPPASRPSSEHGKEVLIERQRLHNAASCS